MLARLIKSDSLRSAVAFAGGGVGFAAGNILLAKILSPASFGVVTLALALNQFGLTFGPFGLEVVANRHRPRVDRRLALLAFSAATITAIGVAVIAGAYYHLSAAIVALILAMVIGSATNRVCVALFQGEGHFRSAMSLSQVHNYVLLVVAVLAAVLVIHNDIFVVGIVAAAYVLSSGLGWWWARRAVNAGREQINSVLALREGAAALGIGVAVQLLSQFERLAIPKIGSLPMLGTYAVLAAVVGSPFRMLQAGTSFSLLPRLRSVSSGAAARSVLLREGAAAASVSAVSIIVVIVAAPWIFRNLLSGKYIIGWDLIWASIAVGMLKVWEGFSTTAVTACGSAKSLVAISVLAWICLVIAAAGMVYGSRYGLVGILYGVGLAWVLLALGGTLLAVRSFKTRFAAPP
jgi:O-antigen/teichoic acid export membrane protein